LKGLAGDALRRTLQRLVGGHFSAIVAGVIFTAAIQSSTAASLTVIGFVSAGLVTLPQAIGVIVGATLGTTTTPWMVAFLGFGVSVSAVALPMLGIGAFLWLIAKGRVRSSGAILAGFGLIFTGIEFLQTGMAGVSWNLEAIAGAGPGAKWILAGIGVAMTVIMQSSSAAAAATLVALYAGSLTFEQGCAMLVGQSVGSAATTALVVIGGSLTVRRTALAHILYTVIVGVLSMLFLGPLAAAANWVGARLDDPDGVLALAAFSSIFKLAGIVVFYPWLDSFANLIVRMSGAGRDSAVSRLDPTIAEAGGAVALEAVWRAILELARGAIEAVRGRLAGQAVAYAPPREAVQHVEHFLESLPLETIDLGTIAPRLVRLTHALDHLAQLHEDLTRIPSTVSSRSLPAGFEASAQALGAWLDATQDPDGTPDSATFAALEASSNSLSAECKASRERTLEDIAWQRAPMATARATLDDLSWADRTLYHAWRLAESLRVAAGQ
jgi:phosphate:Na+ symporter